MTAKDSAKYVVLDGEKVKRLRQAHGLSQEDLAAKLNLTQATISKAETEKKIFNKTAKTIADFFKVALQELLPTDDRKKSTCADVIKRRFSGGDAAYVSSPPMVPETRIYDRHLTNLAWSPDGTLCAETRFSQADGCKLSVFSESGSTKLETDLNDSAYHLDFSNDGKRVLVTTFDQLEIWTVENGTQEWAWPNLGSTCRKENLGGIGYKFIPRENGIAFFSTCDQYIVESQDNDVVVRDAKNTKERFRIAKATTFSSAQANGKLAALERTKNTAAIGIYDLKKKKQIKQIELERDDVPLSLSIALSSAGNLIAYANETTIALMDYASGELIFAEAHGSSFPEICISDDHKRLAVVNGFMSKLVFIGNRAAPMTFHQATNVAGLANAHSGTGLVVFLMDETVRCYDVINDRLIRDFDIRDSCKDFSFGINMQTSVYVKPGTSTGVWSIRAADTHLQFCCT